MTSSSLDDSVGLSVKILVLGDQSVGKTSLVHLLTQRQVLSSVRWTVGCEPHVLVLPSAGGERVFVSLFDVGGAPRFAHARDLFYDDADALLLVHDLSNRRSYSNLRRWLRELSAHYRRAPTPTRWASTAAPSPQRRSRLGDVDVDGGDDDDDERYRQHHDDSNDDADDAAHASSLAPIHVMQLDVGHDRPSLPVLVLGNKLDLVVDATGMDVEGGAADSVHVSAHDSLAFAAGSVGGTAIARLFERAVTHARGRTASTSTSTTAPVLSASPFSTPQRAVNRNLASSLFAALDDDSRARIDGKAGKQS
jgi:Rab-like protein 3